METNSDLTNLITTSQSAVPDIGLVILAIFTTMVVVFSLLVVRQAQQMVKVLPTPVSPIVRLLVFGYATFTVLTLILIINYLI